jgi:surface-anchored protein
LSRTFTLRLLSALAAVATTACSGADEQPPSSTLDGEASEQLVEVLRDADTLVRATRLLELDAAHGGEVADRLARISQVADDIDLLASELEGDVPASGAVDVHAKALSIDAGQLVPELRRLKRAVLRAGLERSVETALLARIATARVAAESLDVAAGELIALDCPGIPLEMGGLDLPDGAVHKSGPLYPGSSIYVLDEGHIDAIDVAYEDDQLGISIHDESVSPDVERDPAKTILVVKSASKTQVPDDRFAFIGPPGADVWLLPEAQPDAQALGVLWPGLATEEIEPGVFVDEQVQVRVKGVLGPNGVSLFFSPPDEETPPSILVDSENGLPDIVTLPVGTHTHLNWAFESPGIYLMEVDVRGQLAGVPGSPWVTSKSAILKWVVLP